MEKTKSQLTIQMAASLDGFIARKDGRVDWLETQDEFLSGVELTTSEIASFLEKIDCYVMGSHTYETALDFESKGFGWPYGEKPTFVLTSRNLTTKRDNVKFHSGDLAKFIIEDLEKRFQNIWLVGGGSVASQCLRLGLADQLRYSIIPIVIGDGIPFFEGLDRDICLHLSEVTPYRSGIVDICYVVTKRADSSDGA